MTEQNEHAKKAHKLLGKDYITGEKPSLYQQYLAFKNLFIASHIEIIEQDPEAFELRLSKANTFPEKIYTMLECMADFAMLEKAARLDNALRMDKSNPIMDIYNKAMDFQPIQDHAWKHVRMFQKGVRYAIMRISRITKGGLASFSFFEEKKFSNRLDQMRACMPIALMRGAGYHDRHQTFTQYYKEMFKGVGEYDVVKPKDNHELYAALMVLLDQRYFKKIRRYSDKRVQLADAMLVLGILGHGETTTYFKELENTKKAYIDLGNGKTKEIPDEELYKLLEKKNVTLDWTSVSPSQILKIAQFLAKRDKLAVFQTETGLPPEIESIYKKTGDIEQLKNNHMPLIYNITQSERDLLKIERQLYAVIDLAEMLLPPLAAGDRKLLTPKSFNRLITAAINPQGDTFNAEEYINQLFNIDGHTCRSDLERQLFEVYEYLRTVQESGLLNDPEIGDQFSHLLVDAFCGTFWYFGNFVDTKIEAQEDFVNLSYRVQAIDAAFKIYGKHGVMGEHHNLENLKNDTDKLMEMPLNELSLYLQGYMTLKNSKSEDLSRIILDIDTRREKLLNTVLHKASLNNDNPLSSKDFMALFEAASSKFSELLGVEKQQLLDRYRIWLERSVQENMHESRVPWASSEQSVGSFTDAKSF